jgi:hypothetical protein
MRLEAWGGPDRAAASCFETHRSAMVLLERSEPVSRCDAPQHEAELRPRPNAIALPPRALARSRRLLSSLLATISIILRRNLLAGTLQ